MIPWLRDLLGKNDHDEPLICECPYPVPDPIGECRICHRPVYDYLYRADR